MIDAGAEVDLLTLLGAQAGSPVIHEHGWLIGDPRLIGGRVLPGDVGLDRAAMKWPTNLDATATSVSVTLRVLLTRK